MWNSVLRSTAVLRVSPDGLFQRSLLTMAAPPTAPSALAVALRKASLPLIPKVKYDELPTVTLQNVVPLALKLLSATKGK